MLTAHPRASASLTRTANPPPATGPTVSRPPCSAGALARADQPETCRVPTTPLHSRYVSTTSNSSSSGQSRACTSARDAPECSRRSSAPPARSCRPTHRSWPPQAAGSPSTRTSTVSRESLMPAASHQAAQTGLRAQIVRITRLAQEPQQPVQLHHRLTARTLDRRQRLPRLHRITPNTIRAAPAWTPIMLT